MTRVPMKLGEKLILGVPVAAKELKDAGMEGIDHIPDHAVVTDSSLSFETNIDDQPQEVINARKFSFTISVVIKEARFAW